MNLKLGLETEEVFLLLSLTSFLSLILRILPKLQSVPQVNYYITQ